MPADENVKEALEKLEKMGYDIEEYDQGYIACILDRSKIQDSKGKENEEKWKHMWLLEMWCLFYL